MQVTLITDIPVWVRPLVAALEARGGKVTVALEPEDVPAEGIVVNRISTRLVRKNREQAARFEQALTNWESEGRVVVNGANCFRFGYSKALQKDLFEAANAFTPPTAKAVPGERRFPDCPVLLKPPAGGFGKGIRSFAAGEPLPDALFAESHDWVEQVKVEPSDGAVHRLEFLGDRILYDASSPLAPGVFDYCLAHANDATGLVTGESLPESITGPARRIAAKGKLQLGALEYLLNHDGEPVFIDFNPVSSLHPQAASVLGEDPIVLTARYLVERIASASRPTSHHHAD